MPHLGLPELLIVLVIILVLFGAGKLADIGGALGKGIREFRKASDDAKEAQEEIEGKSDKSKATEEKA